MPLLHPLKGTLQQRLAHYKASAYFRTHETPRIMSYKIKSLLYLFAFVAAAIFYHSMEPDTSGQAHEAPAETLKASAEMATVITDTGDGQEAQDEALRLE